MKIKLLFVVVFYTLVANSQYNSTLNFSYDKIDSEFSHLLSLDIYSPIVGEDFPVVVFVHGGGWAIGDKASSSHDNKRDFFVEHGYIFVSINYRLAPEVGFPVYPDDVAKATAFVLNWVGKFKGDTKNVFLMGHSSGAHLAALIATDDSYLNQYNYSPQNIKGVILLDSGAYDIPATMQYNLENNNQSGLAIYQTAFGEEINTWDEASPINYISETTPPQIIFYVATREITKLIGTRYFNVLKQYNNSQIYPVENTSHEEINKNFGLINDGVSQVSLEFIQNL